MQGSSRMARCMAILNDVRPVRIQGTVRQVIGQIIEGRGPTAAIGHLCDIYPRFADTPIKAEIVGFKDQHVLLMPLGPMHGICPGSLIVYRGEQARVGVSPSMKGRVLDGLGIPLDQNGPLAKGETRLLHALPINPLRRKRICTPLDLGIRAINGLLTIGKGQRVGIFAGSGVGKSMLLGTIARHTRADVNVIALIGERGREVRDFIEQSLGEEGCRKTVLVVATSDQPPLVRLRGAFIATAIAEYFRDQGDDVLLMVDSITRLAMAQREVGLAIGEPPMAKGYTPGVFSLLPRLLERAGNASDAGSITGLYTVLIENDDVNDPIVDAVRSIVDGHIFLSRDLAAKNHYPAIQILHSLSRVMPALTQSGHVKTANQFRKLLAAYQEAEDLITIGAYVPGNNHIVDTAVEMIEAMNSYLRQDCDEYISLDESNQQLQKLFIRDH